MAKIWLYNYKHPGGKLHDVSAAEVEDMLANGWHENPGEVKAPKAAAPAADADDKPADEVKPLKPE
jgi:hypothetical protein